MPPLKVGKNHLFVEDIRNVITPSAKGTPGSVTVIYRNGDEDTFQGEEADIVRQWLAIQFEPPRPATVPFVQTKSEPAVTAKSAPRR